MPTNPFRRKRDPLEQVLDVLDAVRSDAAKTAADIRDTAAKAADALGDAAPDAASKRLPLIGLAAAGAVAVVIAVRARAGGSAPEITRELPVEPKAETAESRAAADADAEAPGD